MRFQCCCAALVALMICTTPVWAERADRQQPVHLEADRISIDDLKKIQTLEGNVVLTQGTMRLIAEKIVITQDEYGFQRGVATAKPGGLAHYREKREGTNEFIEGEAERIEYDAKTEKTEFFKRAWVRSGGDEVRGDHISYDALTEQYTVNSAEGASAKKDQRPKRVTAIIQPKAKNASEEKAKEPEAPLLLKPSPAIKPN